MSIRKLPLLLLLAAQMLGGCSISGLLPDWTSDDAAGPEPAGYRFFIANRLSGIIGNVDRTHLEISKPQRVDSTKGASWLVCLKRNDTALPLPRYYAVFFQRGEIADSRLSVLIDHCELQTYAPFDWVADANAPPH